MGVDMTNNLDELQSIIGNKDLIQDAIIEAVRHTMSEWDSDIAAGEHGESESGMYEIFGMSESKYAQVLRDNPETIIRRLTLMFGALCESIPAIICAQNNTLIEALRREFANEKGKP